MPDVQAIYVNGDVSCLGLLPFVLGLRVCWVIYCSGGATAVYFMVGP